MHYQYVYTKLLCIYWTWNLSWVASYIFVTINTWLQSDVKKKDSYNFLDMLKLIEQTNLEVGTNIYVIEQSQCTNDDKLVSNKSISYADMI